MTKPTITHWHAEETLRLDVRTGPDSWMRLRKLTLRGYDQADGYAMRVPFVAVLQADVLAEDGRAFVHAAMTRNGLPLTRDQWRAAGRLLKDSYGVRSVIADRHGKPVRFDSLLG
jgi:hypothetical protein